MNITTAWLATADGVCNRPLMDAHIKIFRAEWGDSVEVTRATLMRAAELGFDISWLGQQLIPGWRAPVAGATRESMERFRAIQETAHAEMRAAVDPIHAERARAVAGARAAAASDDELDAIDAAYRAAAAPHLARYRGLQDALKADALAGALRLPSGGD